MKAQGFDSKGLGLVGSSYRPLKDGSKYNKYFKDVPKRTNPILSESATVYQVLDWIKRIVQNTKGQTRELCQKELAKGSLKATLNAVFDLWHDHIQYKKDQDGVEQLRAPLTTWFDKVADCDCYSIAVSSCLYNLMGGIHHFLRIVKRNHSDLFSHIYVVVPKYPNADLHVRTNYYVIDPVLNRFDRECDAITEIYDYPMIPVQYLNGVGQDRPAFRLGHEFDGLGEGFAGCPTPEQLQEDFNQRMKAHLVNVRQAVAEAPHKLSFLFRPDRLIPMLDYVITNWDNPATRSQALTYMAAQEEKVLQPHLKGLSGLLFGQDEKLAVDLLSDAEELLSSCGDNPISGLGDLGKIKLNIKAPVKGFINKVKNATEKVAEVVKEAPKKVVEVAKKVGQAVVKYNPISLAARGGFLLAMKTNIGNIAGRLKWGYATKEQAAAKGYDEANWEKAKDALSKVENMFTKTLQGESSALRDSILKGKAGNLNVIAPEGPPITDLPVVSAQAVPAGSLPTLTTVTASAMTAVPLATNGTVKISGNPVAVSGLGVVETVAAGSAAAAFIAKALEWVKGIISKPVVKTAVQTVKTVADNKKAASNTASSDTLPASDGGTIPNEEVYYPNQDTDDSIQQTRPGGAFNFQKLLVPGLIALAVGGIIIYAVNKRSKGAFAGLEDEDIPNQENLGCPDCDGTCKGKKKTASTSRKVDVNTIL